MCPERIPGAAANVLASPHAGSVVGGGGRYSGAQGFWLLGVPGIQQPEEHLQAEPGAPRRAPSEDHQDCERETAAGFWVVGRRAAHQLLWGLAHVVRLPAHALHSPAMLRGHQGAQL